ncbi:MAG: type II secretion system protein [Clostridia bacterium]|nr:type II secretion system protein [Clostridia bacterium]MBR6005127.1 type II secretion system protein [Clostridia bacterium]
MQKLFAKLNLAKKNNRGFSLVELIIVVAIMVALVALLAPQFVKYITKSRDAVIKTAAEDVLAVSKSEYALGHLSLKGDDSGTITVQTNSQGQLTVFFDSAHLSYCDEQGNELGQDGFRAMCGIDDSRISKSDDAYVITIARGNQFTSEITAATFTDEHLDTGGNSDTPAGGNG